MNTFAPRPRPSLHHALTLKLPESLFEHGNPFAKQPAVRLQLGFSWSTQADPALLTLQVRPATHQPCCQMLQLSQFDLQLAFMTLGTLGKNIQDQGAAIDHPATEHLFQIALLTGRQLMIEHDNVRLMQPGRLADFLCLALAGISRCIRCMALAANHSQRLRSGTGSQQAELRQVFLITCRTEIQLDENGTDSVFRHVILTLRVAVPNPAQTKDSIVRIVLADCHRTARHDG